MKKRCVVCKTLFPPYHRSQKTCPKKRCRSRYHASLKRCWRKSNPDYFKGRYANTKLWLEKHPGYLRRYRRDHEDYVAADNRRRRERRLCQRRQNADIQERSFHREIERIRSLSGADIQESSRLRLDELLAFLARMPRADIQESLASSHPPGVSLPA